MTDQPPPWVIAIGASGAAGLNDLRGLLAEWQNLNAIVMIVLHRPWTGVSYLRQVLQLSSHMPVHVAGQGQQLRPGCVYIGEPSNHLILLSSSIGGLTDDPRRFYGNRTIDLLFQSVATIGGHRTIGVVLSGSLDDGTRGLAEIHDAGGWTMIINPAGQPWPSMPESASSYHGPINVIGDVPVIAREIEKILATDRQPS
ncbi:MAG: chemotaxis protein CheB [Roseovarius sp.]